jgi:tRNA G10  N-methylase Trm11
MEEAQPPNLYLIRFVQVHERFRKPEIEALAKLLCIEFEFLEYSENVLSTYPFTSSYRTSRSFHPQSD